MSSDNIPGNCLKYHPKGKISLERPLMYILLAR
jgi:hypothetical protein